MFIGFLAEIILRCDCLPNLYSYPPKKRPEKLRRYAPTKGNKEKKERKMSNNIEIEREKRGEKREKKRKRKRKREIKEKR